MVSNAPSGVVYDPGGPFGDYYDYNDCNLLIDPGCVGIITLDLTAFQSEDCCDYLAIYDGENQNGQQIGYWRGGIASPVTLSATSGKVFLIWRTDGSVVYSGFRLTWNSTLTPMAAPEADFTVSNTTPALFENVSFIGSGTNGPKFWEWDFGDNSTGSGQNAMHQYAVPGTYTVQMIATNCHQLKDTVIQTITVQLPPVAQVSPTTLNVTSPCTSSGQTTFTIANTGPGDLLFDATFSGPFNFVITPQQGKVAPDTFITVTVEILAQGSNQGNFPGTIIVQTNETPNSYIEVPMTVEITGVPAFFPSPEMVDFGTIRQFETASQYFQVTNNGCAPLEIISVSVDNTIFSVNSTGGFFIDPYQTAYFQIDCAPQDTGQITGNVVFETNIGPINYPVQVTVVGSPVLTITPPSLDVYLMCHDSTTVTVKVANTGLADLNIVAGQTATPVNVLVLDGLSSYSDPVYYIINWIYEINPLAQFSYFPNYLSQEAIDNLFGQADVVVLPSLGGFGSYTAEQIKTALQQFTNRGGTVLVTGTSYTGYLQDLGLFQIGPDVPNFYGQVLTPINPASPLVANIDFQNDISYNNIFGLDIQNTDFVADININGYDIVGYRPSGNGKVIYIGHQCYNGYNQDRLLVQNAFRWASGPKWLSYELPTSVSAGDSVEISFKIRSEDLWAGDYQYQANFSTNDPVHPYATIPVTLHVNGASEIALLTPFLNFGVLQQFAQQAYDVTVGNNGCDTLLLNDFVFSGGDFSMGNIPPFILPGATQNLQVIFQPQGTGNYLDTLTIQSNGGIVSLPLKALVVGAPIAAANPEVINVALNCDQTKTVDVAISNSGIGTFHYSANHTGAVKVVVLRYGALYYRYDNMIAQFTSLVPNLQLTVIDSPDPVALADSLAAADILVIPSIEYEDQATFSAFKTPVQNFINKGGIVLMGGVYQTNPLIQMGLIGGATTFDQYPGSLVKNALPTHPMAAGISGTSQEVTYQYDANFLPTSGFKPVLKLQLDNQTYRDYLSYKSVGDGFLVWFGFPFESASPLTDQIIGNFFQWAYQPLAPGVTLTSGTAGSLPTSGTQSLGITFTGNNLPGGTYPGQVRLYGDDPVNNPVIIPMTIDAGTKPCIAFDALKENCGGEVHFVDQTFNALTSWYWSFGDGFEAFTANPTHTYTQEGEYTATLVGCNSVDCDTMQQIVLVDNIDGPLAAACIPSLINPCCDAGIQRLQLGTIDHTSGNAATEGYKDFSCFYGTDLTAGGQYAVAVTTGTQSAEYVSIWIDFNNDGDFTANEKCFNDNNLQIHEGFITIPANAVKDVKLRLRINSDLNYAAGACGIINYGQAEDYYVVVKALVGAQEPDQSLQARIFPNPTAGQSWLDFTTDAAQTAELTITNQTGQIIQSQTLDITSGAQKINLPHQEAGVYMVRLQTGDKSYVTKWVCL